MNGGYIPTVRYKLTRPMCSHYELTPKIHLYSRGLAFPRKPAWLTKIGAAIAALAAPMATALILLTNMQSNYSRTVEHVVHCFFPENSKYMYNDLPTQKVSHFLGTNSLCGLINSAATNFLKSCTTQKTTCCSKAADVNFYEGLETY